MERGDNVPLLPMEGYKMSENKWNFDFADVKITIDRIIVNSTIPYKKLYKEYKDLINEVSDEAQNTLEEVFVKKRKKDKPISESERNELIMLFIQMAGGGEQQASYEPGEEMYEPGSDVAVRDTATTDISYEEGSLYKIYIMEEVELTLEHNGKMETSEISGKVSVENQGKKDRIWDIDITLKETQNTDIEEEDIHILKLETGDSWEKEYKITPELVEKPPLEIIESINTYTETPEENTTLLLQKEHDVEFNIILENNSDGRVLDIEFEKEFPEEFRDIKKMDKNIGEVDRDDNKIIWKIEKLDPKSQAKLRLGAKILPESTDPVPTGMIRASYFLSEGTFSGLRVKKADGFSKNIFTINKDERREEPDRWDCSFKFMNKSEFPFLLENISILSGDVDTEELAVQFNPRMIVPPGDDWVSESWDIQSEDVPTFGKKVLFTLLPDVDEELRAKVSVKPMELYVLSFKGEKTYDKYEVPSYKTVLVKTVNESWSEGPVDLESLILEDVIPENFRPPIPEDVKFFINEEEIGSEKYRVEISPSVDYDSENYPDRHNLTLRLENIPDLVEPGTEMKVRLEYNIESVKPKPEMEYKGDCLFKAYPVNRGPEIELELIPNIIEVTHIRRSETISKSVFPGGAKDEYEILLTYENRGNHTITEKAIVDQIPADFELISMDPEGQVEESDEFSRISWTFKDIEPNEEVSVTYLIKGEGDYKAGETEIFAMA
jgi:hypothetical protein